MSLNSLTNFKAFSYDFIVTPLPFIVSTISKSDKILTARLAVSEDTLYWLANVDLVYILSPIIYLCSTILEAISKAIF